MGRAASRILLASCALVAALARVGAQGAGVDEEPPVPVYEVFQLRVEDGGLVLRTTMPPTPEEEFRSMVLAGEAGTADLVTSGGAPGAGPGGPEAPAPAAALTAAVPDLFRLEVSNDNRPGRRIGVRVTWHDGALDVNHNAYFTGRRRYTRVTRLLASRNPEFGPRPSVQLMVTEQGDIGREPVEVNLVAPDFVTLRREHDAALDEYLRPLLRELGQEHVFAPDRWTSQVIFPDRWPADEAMTRAVERLLPGLEAEDADDRETASARMADLGRDAVPALLRLDRAPLSAEQNGRIDAVVAGATPITRTRAARHRRHVPFLLDCLNSDDPVTRAAGLHYLREAVDEPVEFDPDLPVPARGAAVAALREKLTPEPPVPD